MDLARLNRFLDDQARVRTWPKRQQDKELVSSYLVTKFEFGKIYDEIQVNFILKQWHTFSDWPLLRRELFERGFMVRNINGSEYQRLK